MRSFSLFARASLFALLVLGLLLASSGRLDWVMAWFYAGTYWAILTVATVIVHLDPELVSERSHIRDGVKAWDKPLAIILSIPAPAAIWIIAGLDMRYGWSQQITPAPQFIGLIIAALGSLLNISAMASNRFFSRFVRIQKDRGHTVVSNGPYRYVRHPGYVGGMTFALGSALALGSSWALVPTGIMALLIIIRTALEDKTLQQELEGYKDYAARVHYRLVPGLW